MITQDNFIAIITLFITFMLLMVLGYFCILRPNKVRDTAFKLMAFFHKYKLEPFYKSRTELMNSPGFLLYLRIMGVLIVAVGFLLAYLLFRKWRELS